MPKAQAIIEAFKPRLAGKLYFSFGAVQKADTRVCADFGDCEAGQRQIIPTAALCRR